MSNLSNALKYAKMGIRVFPCKPTKAPRPRNGYHAGTTDVKTITAWWKKHPGDMIGGVCDNTFTVIDVDCGGVCPQEQKDIILSVVEELKEYGVIDSSTPCVKTKSGGYHYYLASTNDFTRKINYLPAIDLLATNGYVILPDGESYTLLDGKFDIKSLHHVNSELLDFFHEKYDDVRKEVKWAIDVAKGKNPRKPRTSKSSSTVKEKNEYQDMYSKTDEYEEIDPTSTLLVEGKIHIDDGMLDTSLLNALFFNQEIQTLLAKFLGLRVPAIKKSSGRVKGTLQRSILVGHKDSSPSMGVRWTQVESHLLARDFSDHHSDGLNDYNVVRLYMNRMYGKNIAKPSKPEWVTWFVRMLFDAGIIEVKHHLQFVPIVEELFKGHDKKIKAANSIFLLNALKRLHSKYEGEFPVTKSFMSAWCKDVHKNTSYNTLKELIANNLILHTSTEKLSEKRNLFLYKVNPDAILNDETSTNEKEGNEMTKKKTKKQIESEMAAWLSGKPKKYKNIGELDKAEADKLDWSDEGVDWEVFHGDPEEYAKEYVNTKTPPS